MELKPITLLMGLQALVMGLRIQLNFFNQVSKAVVLSHITVHMLGFQKALRSMLSRAVADLQEDHCRLP